MRDGKSYVPPCGGRYAILAQKDSTMLQTTETLLQGLAANDQNRWARFYRDYAPWIENNLLRRGLSHEDAEEVVHDKARKGAFHSLLFKIAQNKAIDRLRKIKGEAERLAAFASEPLLPSDEDWRRETFNMALRRVFANPDIGETSKIAFRRFVQLGEPAETVAHELGLTVNNLYQIKNRLKKRLTDEVRRLQENSPDGE